MLEELDDLAKEIEKTKNSLKKLIDDGGFFADEPEKKDVEHVPVCKYCKYPVNMQPNVKDGMHNDCVIEAKKRKKHHVCKYCGFRGLHSCGKIYKHYDPPVLMVEKCIICNENVDPWENPHPLIHESCIYGSPDENETDIEVEKHACKYCNGRVESENEAHDICIREYEDRKRRKVCTYCGSNHDGSIKCNAYIYYNTVFDCMYCYTIVDGELNDDKNRHDECYEEDMRRIDDNECRYCSEKLTKSDDIMWNYHLDICGETYLGYKRPNQIKKKPKKVKVKKPDTDGSTHIKKLVGGMDVVIDQMTDNIWYPLINQQRFIESGIKSPKGVLLHGPAGCGKTMLGKYLANQDGINYHYVAAPSMHGKYVGQTEERIRSVFKKAISNQPSIIFIDEIDSLGKDREGTDRNYQNDITEQLLTSMDDINDKNIIVVGATNDPSMLDAALRRPGRFDVEIYVPVPDINARESILQMLLKDMKLSNVNIKEMAKQTSGYTGADLSAMVGQAGKSAIKRSMDGTSIVVTGDDFTKVLAESSPSLLRKVQENIDKIKWDDIGGLGDIKNSIQEDVIWPRKYKADYEAMEITPSKGILLYGQPGTGKTMIAKAIASETESSFITVGCSELISSHPGKTEKNIRKLFKSARESAPCVLFMDEIDSIIPARNININDNRIVSQILMELDGVRKSGDVILIGATNMPNLVDPAALRPGRFDKIIQVSPPDIKGRKEIFMLKMGNKPREDINYDRLAELTEGMTGAEIAKVVNVASMNTLRSHVSGDKKLKITQQDLEDAIKNKN